MSGRVSFDLVAASLRADSTDAATFLEVLAAKLEGALPGRVQIQRKGRLFGGPKRVCALTLTMGEHQYELRAHQGRLMGRRRRVVGGIALKTDELDLDGWIDAVSTDLAELAVRSERDRLALERLLGA